MPPPSLATATASPPAAAKLHAVDKILARHPQQALIIGGYVDQLKELGAHLDAPVIDGSTSTAKRERLFQQFRDGTLPVLVVSKVANFSIDLPEAALAIQVSGTFGSRQEEAQRLGRLLRPKEEEALFTRWSPAIASTRTTPCTASVSSPSRDMPTGLSTH